MAWEKRVVWSEGMMLQPQHFQQQSRYHESQLRESLHFTRPHFWGVASLSIDASHLKHGKVCITKGQGILPDGSYFDFPAVDHAPDALDITDAHLNSTVYLAVTIRRHGNTETYRDNSGQSRFRMSEHEARDISGTSAEQQCVEVAGLNFCLRTDKDDNNEFNCIPIAVIEDVSNNGVVTLKEAFISPCLNIKHSGWINSFISELVKLASHRCEALAARVTISGKASTSEITDFLMLQTLNRYLPQLINVEQAEYVTPYDFYQMSLALTGDMSTFIQPDKRVPSLPPYRHDNLTETFVSLIDHLRHLFSAVLQQNSVQIPLQEKKYGIRVGVVADKTLFSSASFILAVHADVPPEEIRQHFPPQVKIGAIEQIKELVNVQLPGIRINNLAVAPREIPYQRNYVYFELVQTGEYWNALHESGGIAIHVSTQLPNLVLELWAVRG